MNRYQLLRYEHGKTLVAVADATGLAMGTLRSIEADDYAGMPTAPVAKALADYYGIPVAELLGVTDREAA
jgi:transcriptional regulator with XRE-family HTH domain